MNILVINGFEEHRDANGQLNHRLFTEYVRQLKTQHMCVICNRISTC